MSDGTPGPKVPRRKKRKVPPMLKWLRSIGFLSLVFGGGSVLFAGWFLSGVIFIYVGFAVLAIDLWFEPDVSLRWRLIGIAIAVAVAISFSLEIVFVKTPLEVGAVMTDAEYPVGTTPLAGITWRPQFTELQVWMTNPTDESYDDVNVIVRPSTPIAAIAEELGCVTDAWFS
jgi:hypothetical protein